MEAMIVQSMKTKVAAFMFFLFLTICTLPSSQGKRLNHIMTKEQGEEIYEQQNERGLERRRDLKGHLRTQHDSLIQNHQSCYITTKITCQILSTGDPCDEIASVSKSMQKRHRDQQQLCEPIDVYFKFTYCNNKIYDENENGHDAYHGNDKKKEEVALHIGALPVPYVRGEISMMGGKHASHSTDTSASANSAKRLERIHDHSLKPQTCRVLGHESTINSCSKFIDAYMNLSAWEDGEMDCTSSDVYKVVNSKNQVIVQ